MPITGTSAPADVSGSAGGGGATGHGSVAMAIDIDVAPGEVALVMSAGFEAPSVTANSGPGPEVVIAFTPDEFDSGIAAGWFTGDGNYHVSAPGSLTVLVVALGAVAGGT